MLPVYEHYIAAEVTFAVVFNLNKDKPTDCDLFLPVHLPNDFKREKANTQSWQ